tara:strand:+ start:2839 stop:3711 length:873 start_codon:yes stop_codon:yes gene_type:complete
MTFVQNTQTINLNYTTNNHNINFDISFGIAKNSEYSYSEDRGKFNDRYNIEIYELGLANSDEYQKGYRVLANEGPIAINIKNINIISNNDNNYDYALGFALDIDEPTYLNESDIIPNNIVRDGTLWTINANKMESQYFDQNPRAKYQWNVKRALEKGYVPSVEEKELGIEETSDNTGLFYLTFMVFRKEKKTEEITRGVTRGVTRGATRGPTRGCAIQDESVAGRFGYGNEAKTSSVKSEYKYIMNTERYILPIRTRINSNSEISNINCSKTINGANLNALKKQTMTVPF